MEIVCNQCKARLSVSDEKIPKDKDVTLTCPKCSNHIIIGHDNKSHKAGPQNFSDEHKDVLVNEKKPEDFILHHDYGSTIALLLYSSTAGNRDLLKKVASDLGYIWHTADTEKDAASMILLNNFDLIVICEEFCKKDSFSDSPVLKQIRLMTPSARRVCFIVLIGKDLTTNDRMNAFILNANLVVNNKDIENIGTILNSSLKENKNFYSVFTLEKEKDHSV